MSGPHTGKIGLFGGSFDPIHYGHLYLALQLYEIHALKEVWLIPCAWSPLKEGPPMASFEDRFKMASSSISSIPSFYVSDCEKSCLGPSYTIDTLHFFENTHPSDSFCLLLGEDQIEELSQWRHIEQIISRCDLLIGSRPQESFRKTANDRYKSVEAEEDKIKRAKSKVLNQAIERGLTPTKCMEISSTEIRQRMLAGLYCGHLLDSKAVDYIRENRLYFFS